MLHLPTTLTNLPLLTDLHIPLCLLFPLVLYGIHLYVTSIVCHCVHTVFIFSFMFFYFPHGAGDVKCVKVSHIQQAQFSSTEILHLNLCV